MAEDFLLERDWDGWAVGATVVGAAAPASSPARRERGRVKGGFEKLL